MTKESEALGLEGPEDDKGNCIDLFRLKFPNGK